MNLEGTETSEYASLGDAGPNVYRTAQKVRKQFTITLNRKEWNKIRPLKGSTKLRPPWTHYLYNAFKKRESLLHTFKYKNTKAAHSRKTKCPYLHIVAICTFPSCQAKYKFKLKTKPERMCKIVKILVSQHGQIKHKVCEKRFRPATNLKRGALARAITRGPSHYFY